MTDIAPEVEELELDDLPPDPPDFDPCEDDDAAPAQAFGLLAATTTQHPITWLPAAFDLWRARYRKVAGWEDRGRPPSSGAFRPNGSLTIHHTGPTSSASDPHPSLGLVTRGRTDLAGPLCQISTDYNGVTSIVAAGRANHAGTSKAFGVNPAGDGNAMYIGNEVDTNGTQRMPQAQYDAVVLSSCAILHHYGVKPDEVDDYLALHATTSTSGKWDLGAGEGRSGVPYPRRDLVADVKRRLAAGPTTTQEDEVTPQDIQAVVDGVLGSKVIPANMLVSGWKEGDPTNLVAIPRALDLVMRWALEGRDNAIVARTVAEAQAQLGRPMSAEEVSAAVKSALSEAARIEVVVKPEGNPA